MLLDLRDGIRNSKWLKYVLVTIICIPFVFFGINSYLGGHGPDYSVKVNGEKVSLNAFQSAYQQERAQFAQQFGGQIPAGLAGMVNSRVMNNLVSREVIRQSTENNNLAVSDDSLAESLLEVSEFNVDGSFNKERYEMQLQSMGVSAADFENQYRSNIIQQQFSGSVLASGFSLASEDDKLSALTRQKRNLETITFDVAARAETIEVSESDIQTHYDENTARFNNPQKVTVEYIELKVDDLLESIEVTDADLKGYYDSNKTQWVVPEKRDASHILLSVEDNEDEQLTLANALVERINGGESFEDLAKEFSDDPGSGEQGGSLGEFGRGVMVGPFEEAVFAMQVDEVSAPVKSDFGYHIIRLNNIIDEQGQSFDEVKAEVEQKFRTEQAEIEFFAVSDLLSNASYENSDSLQPAADETALEIQTSDWIDTISTEGIGQYRQVISAALSDEVLNQGLNSEVLEVGENHSIVLRTLDHEEAAPKPLSEVSEEIVGTLQTERATEQLTDLATGLQSELAGADASAIASSNGGEYADHGAVARNQADLDRAINGQLFKMPKPSDAEQVFDTVNTNDGNIALIIFGGVVDAEPEAQPEDEDAPSPPSPPAISSATEFQAMLATLQESAVVERNEALLGELENSY